MSRPSVCPEGSPDIGGPMSSGRTARLTYLLRVIPQLILLLTLGQAATARASGLGAPSGLTARAISETQISLSWADNSTNEAAFQIERSPTPSSGFTLLATTGSNATSFQNTNLAVATSYYYRVAAVRNGNRSAYSNVAGAITDLTAPSVPSSVSAVASTCTQINVSWSASTD